MWLSLTIILFCIILFVRLPNVDELRDVRYLQPLRMLTAEGELITQIGSIKRTPINFEDVPQSLINALLSAEDSRFFRHFGLDLRGLARAVIQLVTQSKNQTGASTITMQVARNYYLTRERTIIRKLNEILLAIKMERTLNKEEIFSLYINKIFLGFKSYGMAAAAQTYYNKDLSKLSLSQHAMLAALPKAPSGLNPISNPKRAKERRDWVLSRMAHLGYISRGQYLSAVAEPLSAAPYDYTTAVEANYPAERARIALLDAPKKYGIVQEEIYTAGYSVYTTIRKDLQKQANLAVRAGILAYDRRHGWRGSEQQFEELTESDQFNPDNPAYVKILKNLAEVSSYDGSLEPAIVREVREQSVSVILSDGSAVNLDWKGLKWAAPYISVQKRGPSPKTAADILSVGDMVRITPMRGTKNTFQLAQLPAAEGAFIATNPRNGKTVAMVGGYHFQRSEFNRAIQARRQIGSAIKPFIYAYAFEKGYTGADIYRDAPLVGKAADNFVWRPSNVGDSFLGYIPLRQGLYRSRNLVSIRLIGDLGVDNTRNFMEKFGFPKQHLPRDASLALGSSGLTPYEVVRAYGVFANGGYLIDPYVIERVESREGEILYQHPSQAVTPTYVGQNTPGSKKCRICNSEGINDLLSTKERKALGCDACKPHINTQFVQRVLEPATHYQIHSVLKDVVKRGTAIAAGVLKREDLAGKTGTTQEYADAWFAGYHPSLAAVSWVGFDRPATLGPREFGGVASLPIWIDFMRPALRGVSTYDFAKPENLLEFSVSIPPRNANSPGIKFTEYVPADHLNKSIERAQKNTEFVNYHYLFPTQAGIKAENQINSSQKEKTERALKELF